MILYYFLRCPTLLLIRGEGSFVSRRCFCCLTGKLGNSLAHSWSSRRMGVGGLLPRCSSIPTQRRLTNQKTFLYRGTRELLRIVRFPMATISVLPKTNTEIQYSAGIAARGVDSLSVEKISALLHDIQHLSHADGLIRFCWCHFISFSFFFWPLVNIRKRCQENTVLSRHGQHIFWNPFDFNRRT